MSNNQQYYNEMHLSVFNEFVSPDALKKVASDIPLRVDQAAQPNKLASSEEGQDIVQHTAKLMFTPVVPLAAIDSAIIELGRCGFECTRRDLKTSAGCPMTDRVLMRFLGEGNVKLSSSAATSSSSAAGDTAASAKADGNSSSQAEDASLGASFDAKIVVFQEFGDHDVLARISKALPNIAVDIASAPQTRATSDTELHTVRTSIKLLFNPLLCSEKQVDALVSTLVHEYKLKVVIRHPVTSAGCPMTDRVILALDVPAPECSAAATAAGDVASQKKHADPQQQQK